MSKAAGVSLWVALMAFAGSASASLADVPPPKTFVLHAARLLDVGSGGMRHGGSGSRNGLTLDKNLAGQHEAAAADVEQSRRVQDKGCLLYTSDAADE